MGCGYTHRGTRTPWGRGGGVVVAGSQRAKSSLARSEGVLNVLTYSTEEDRAAEQGIYNNKD